MNSGLEIKRILIIGGGTSGWMSAVYLNRFLMHSRREITLIESPSLAPIGVGEATLPTLVRFIRNMEFDEREFMRECKATYKLGIKFTDWIEKNYIYWHPFGICGSPIDGIDLFHFWLKLDDTGKTRYSDYSLQALVADRARAPRYLNKSSQIIDSGAYAYHLDASLFAAYLKKKATGSGVKYIQSDVDVAITDNKGQISQVKTADGRVLTADLYIDCTGFQGLLIGKTLKVDYIDWSDRLLCNRAVVLPRPVDQAFHPNTRSTALSAGWCWQIPLTDRMGCGYVYSNNHLSDEDAAGELGLFVSGRRKPAGEFRYLVMPVGHRRLFWSGNCIAIGLAGGFVEPLESTGIHFIQQGLESLMGLFPDKNFNPVLCDAYNRNMASTYEEIRDFIMLHYMLTTRSDSSFWVDCRQVNIPDSLSGLLDMYGECGVLSSPGIHVFPDTSYFHILSGGRRLPRRASPMIYISDISKVREILERIKQNNSDTANTFPEHKSYIDSLYS